MAYTLRAAATSSPAHWQADQLITLKADELSALCQLMGFAHSGTKQAKVDRLISWGQVYSFVAPYRRQIEQGSDQKAVIQALADRLNGRTLGQLSRQCGVFVHSTKYGRAASLIGWACGCRSRGQRALEQAKAEISKRPKQLNLLTTTRQL